MTRPLDGISVLDFTHGVAGPVASMILGDLGAEVLKIEKPGRGDPTRYMNVSRKFLGNIPRTGGDYFLAINRNKRSITIDIKEPEGRDLCLALGERVDVVLQNFRPGVMKRLGLGIDDFTRRNPRLIHGTLSAYPDEGSLADAPGMDVAIQARAGLLDITGEPGSDVPVKPGASLADFSGGIFLAQAVLAALFERERRGHGQSVSVSLIDATMSMLANYSIATMDGHAELAKMGSGHPQLAPFEAYPTADGHIVISAGTNKIFRHFCSVVGLERLADDPAYATNPSRVQHRVELFEAIAGVTRLKPTAHWLETFAREGIPSAPVNTMAQAFAELADVSPGAVVEVEHPHAGTLHMLGSPLRMSATPPAITLPPPLLGEHTTAVLAERLSLGADRLADLQARSVI